jgi:hypothetical protein
MPMHLAQRARIDVHSHRGQRGLYGELFGRNDSRPPACKGLGNGHRLHPESVPGLALFSIRIDVIGLPF